jgi:hypothetical protein
MEDADRGDSLAEEPDDVAARSSKLPLQRFRPLHWGLEMLLKEFRENIHSPR